MQAEYVVAGMSCEHCVTSVTNELTQLDGVTAVDIDLASGRVAVSSSHPLAESAVRAAVDEAGYELMDSGSTSVR